MGSLGFGLHVFNIDNATIIVDKGHRKGYQSIAHPHAMLGLFIENEQHSTVGWQFRSKHQSALALRRVRSNFCMYYMHART